MFQILLQNKPVETGSKPEFSTAVLSPDSTQWAAKGFPE
jgi:hypothetical protein